MSDLPRKTVVRTAKLAALPLGFASRTAWGLGRRLGGATSEQVLSDVQQRTAEQLFRTLGELKGGAMKFGQVLSVMESALPEQLAAPYRQHLTRLQDSAPPMLRETVHEQLTKHLGPDWATQLIWINDEPSAAASIGQVHYGQWIEPGSSQAGEEPREVAVKVQYPGAEKALMSDLRTVAKVARGLDSLFTGIDVKALIQELLDRAEEELDYRLEAQAQAEFASAFDGDPEIVIPHVVAVSGHVLVTEWLESPHSLAQVIATGTQAERDHYGELLVRFLFAGPGRTGMLHADPHPGNFRVLPNEDGSPGRLGVLDFGAVARLEDGQLPEAMGRLIRIALDSDHDQLVDGLRDEGFIKPHIDLDGEQLLAYLAPFVEPLHEERFQFTREWMRDQFNRINDPRQPTYTLATKLNLPPAYLLIHRTWLGGLGLLSQLECEVPFRAILEESLPGFAR